MRFRLACAVRETGGTKIVDFQSTCSDIVLHGTLWFPITKTWHTKTKSKIYYPRHGGLDQPTS